MVSLGIFSVVPPTEPCALRSTQPLKVSTRDFFWGKGGLCVWLTTYHPCSVETSRKFGALSYPEPLGPPRPVAETFTLLRISVSYPVDPEFSAFGYPHILCVFIHTSMIFTTNPFELLIHNFSTIRTVNALNLTKN